MRRREFIAGLDGVVASQLAGGAQQPDRMWRVGCPVRICRGRSDSYGPDTLDIVRRSPHTSIAT
jgi:hypothetical protein